MKVYIGSDHAGFALKERIKEQLIQQGFAVSDCGAYAFEKDDDYVDFVSATAKAVAADPTSRGIVIGGSGQGEGMVANKIPGIRCAVFYTPAVPAQAIDVTGQTSEDPFTMLALTREHNDANVLSLSARFLSELDAFKAVEVFLGATFSGEERHVRRIEKIKKLEEGAKG